MIDWISKSEYAKETNKSVVEVQRLIDQKLIEAVLSDGGGKWLIKVERNEEVKNLVEKMNEVSKKMDLLSKHLGLNTDAARRI